MTPWETVIELCPLTSLDLVEKSPCGNHAAGGDHWRRFGEQQTYDASSGCFTSSHFALLPSAAMAGGCTILVELHPLYNIFVNTCTNDKKPLGQKADGMGRGRTKGEKKKESLVHTPVTFRVCRQTDVCLRGCVGFSLTAVRSLTLRTVVRMVRHKPGDR